MELIELIFEGIGIIISVASFIVKITPTTKDNLILDKIINCLEKLSIFNTKENEKKIIDNNIEGE